MKYRVTKSELEILNVLWKAGEPLSRADILEKSTGKTWKDNSIHIFLNGMLKKGIIHEAGFKRSGKVWGRLYEPAITIEEYYADQFADGISPDPIKLLQILINSPNLDEKKIEKLLSTLEQVQRDTTK